MRFPSFLKPTETGTWALVIDKYTIFTLYPYLFSCLWRRRVVKRSSLCVFHSWWVTFGNSQLISWFFSLLLFHILSFFLEPDWFIFKCTSFRWRSFLKHTRTFLSWSKIWGLYWGPLVPFVFWHPAISGLISYRSLRFDWAGLLVGLQVKPGSLLPWGLCFGWYCQECSSSHRYSLPLF